MYIYFSDISFLELQLSFYTSLALVVSKRGQIGNVWLKLDWKKFRNFLKIEKKSYSRSEKIRVGYKKVTTEVLTKNSRLRIFSEHFDFNFYRFTYCQLVPLCIENIFTQRERIFFFFTQTKICRLFSKRHIIFRFLFSFFLILVQNALCGQLVLFLYRNFCHFSSMCYT